VRGEGLVRHGPDAAEHREALVEPGRERDEVDVADARDVGVAERVLVHLVHLLARRLLELRAQLADDDLERRAQGPVGERLAAGERVEALLEREPHRTLVGLELDALELGHVDRVELLDQNLRLLRDRLVRVAPLVDAGHDRDALAELHGQLLGRLLAQRLEHLRLREAEEALELRPHHRTRVLVRVRDLVLHEDTDADELGEERREEVRGGQRSLRGWRRVTAECRVSHQIDGRITSSSDLVRRGIHLGYVVFAM
jgi:hypothetical protein